MAVVRSNSFPGGVGQVSFTLTAPNYLAIPTEARRRVTAAITAEIKEVNKRILRAAKKGYPYEPLNSSFKTIQRASLKNNEFQGGIATADRIFIPLEYGSGPAVGKPSYTPPINRNGAPGTGLEGYAERYGINVYYLQSVIKKKGTKAKQVVTPVFKAEAAQFPANLDRRIRSALAGGVV